MKKIGVIAITIMFLMILNGCISFIESDSYTDQSSNGANQQAIVKNDEKINVFSGDCGISATAEMGTDMFGSPALSVSITNITDKDIGAIKFYSVPFDVYGEEIKGIFSENYLSTDNTIPAGASDKLTWSFFDGSIKTIKLYVYSVYYSDGTEWGDKDATRSTILKNAKEIIVEGKSEN